MALLTIAAWLPSLQPYVPVAEDYSHAHVAQPGVNAYWQWFVSHSQQEGLWRVIGLPLTDFARNVHPFGFPALSILFQVINGILVGLLCQRLGSSPQLSLAAAIAFAVLPSAIEANMYAVASQSMQATTVFLVLALYYTKVLRRERPGVRSLVLCGVAALVGNSIQENLLFAYAVLPAAVAHVLRPLPTWTRAHVDSVLKCTVCTLIAIGTYTGVTMSLRSDPTKVVAINPGTLVSFPAYQYTNLYPYQVWGHPDLVATAVEHQSVAAAATSAALLLAGLFLAHRAFGRFNAVIDQAARARDRRVLEAALVLWYSAGVIFVLAGGYSFESRKKYVTLMFLSILVAFVATRIGEAVRNPRWRRAAATGAAALVVATAATTWMVSTLWILETRRGAALVRLIVAHPEIERVHVRFIPNVLAEWPNWLALASSQHSSDWVTEFAMQHRFDRTVTRVATAEEGAAVIECRYLEGLTAACELVASP